MKSLIILIRLSMMMFIQFFIWGAWYVTAPSYLSQIGFEGNDFGWTYSVGPIAGILAPFFLGMVADRYFATERVLGVLHLLGAATMVAAALCMKTSAPSPSLINWLFFAHMLCYYPTLALANSLALSTMDKPEWQFPWVRVFGTIGWIVAGVVLTIGSWGASVNMFYIAAGAAGLLGLYSFTLPHTPPPAKGKSRKVSDIFGVEALKYLMGRRAYVVFVVSSMLICVPLAFYYQMAARTIEQANIANTPLVMSYGQMSEIFFMVAMPLFFAVLGVKWMLLVGMLAWVARYVLFSIGAPDHVVWMLYAGVILHGICYDFFFVTGQIYTDRVAPEHIRAQAQGLLVFFTLGVGMFFGAKIGGFIEARYTPPEFGTKMEPVANLNQEIEAMQADLQAGRGDRAALESAISDKTAEREKLRVEALQTIDWRSIWRLPAIGAGIIMVLFALLFFDDGHGRAVEKAVAGTQ